MDRTNRRSIHSTVQLEVDPVYFIVIYLMYISVHQVGILSSCIITHWVCDVSSPIIPSRSLCSSCFAQAVIPILNEASLS